MNYTLDNEREGGREEGGGGEGRDEIDGWMWRIVRRDKENEKNEERTGRRDKRYRVSKWKCVRKKEYSI